MQALPYPKNRNPRHSDDCENQTYQSAPHRRARTLRQTHSGKSINAMEKENEWDNR